MKKDKTEIKLYNISEAEKEKIREIFTELDINIEMQEIKQKEDIIALIGFCAFIKSPISEEEKQSLELTLSFLQGWEIIFFVDEYFFENTEKVKEDIKYYHEEANKIKINYDYNDIIKDGIIGFAIGDALGVPAEFKTRDELRRYPITDMVGNGTYNMPKGTWSDDTSMTLATMESIIESKKIDTINMAVKFLEWFRESKYTATEETFDIGRTTMKSLAKFELGIENPKECGQSRRNG